MEIGSVVKLKNIIFSDYNNKGINHDVDHAMFGGRPCVFIGEINDKMYFLPLTSSESHFYNSVVISPSYENGLIKRSSINIKTIIEKPIAYYKVYGIIENYYIDKVYNKIKKYYINIYDNKSKAVVTLAYADKDFKYKDQDELDFQKV